MLGPSSKTVVGLMGIILVIASIFLFSCILPVNLVNDFLNYIIELNKKKDKKIN